MESYSDSGIQSDFLDKISPPFDHEKIFMDDFSFFDNESTGETNKLKSEDVDEEANTFEEKEHSSANFVSVVGKNEGKDKTPLFKVIYGQPVSGSPKDNSNSNNIQEYIGHKRKGPKPKENKKSKYPRKHVKESGDNMRSKIYSGFMKYCNQNIGNFKTKPEKLNRELMGPFLRQSIFDVIENPNSLTVGKIFNIFLKCQEYNNFLEKASSEPEYKNKLNLQGKQFINFFSKKPRKKKKKNNPNQDEKVSMSFGN